jgi:Na+/H+ antiporter NhaD/arsenite permease-like protein
MPGVEQTKTAGLGTLWDFIIYGGIVCATGVLLFFLLRDVRQTLAAVTFIATVLGTLMFWKFRVGIAFLGLVLLLFTRAVDLTTAIDFMQLDVILFLVAMMVIVGVLRQSGFFRWLLVRGLRLTNFEPIFVLIAIMILAGVMAALVDEVTSILFTAALVLELCDHLGINPVKYIISVVLATNIGSSWTVLGNPIGILIAFRSGLTFEDFLTLAMPVGAISLFFLIGIVLIWNIKDFPELREVYKLQLATGGARDQAADAGVRFLDEWAIIKDRKLFIGGMTIFILVIVSLVLDHRLELWFGLEPNTLLFATPVLGAGIIMLWRRSEAREYIQRDVDWWTLVFFMFLFAEAGCLQYIGITDRIADAMLNLARDANVQIPIVLMLWVSGFLSAIADNVVVVAGLIPVAQALSTGLGSVAPWWALLFGGCYGGNMTMIGSTANIVALGMLERKTGHLITIGYWLKIGLLASLVPMAIATGALLIFR